jgi:hypothetical protein
MGLAENASITLELTGMARRLRAWVIDLSLQRGLIRYQGLGPKRNSGPKPGSYPSET